MKLSHQVINVEKQAVVNEAHHSAKSGSVERKRLDNLMTVVNMAASSWSLYAFVHAVADACSKGIMIH